MFSRGIIPMLALLRPRLAAGFAAHMLAPFDITVMDQVPASICGLWPNLRIGYVNPAWLAFGRANGAAEDESRWGLGANVRLVTPEVLRPFYDRLFARARQTWTPVEHEYECSTPSLFRTFRMRVHPTDGGAFVVVHSLVREAAYDEEAQAGIEATYRNERGIIEQCAHCRRVRRARGAHDATAEWDWVPDYVARMPARTSHGICAVCRAYFYPEFLAS